MTQPAHDWYEDLAAAELLGPDAWTPDAEVAALLGLPVSEVPPALVAQYLQELEDLDAHVAADRAFDGGEWSDACHDEDWHDANMARIADRLRAQLDGVAG